MYLKRRLVNSVIMRINTMERSQIIRKRERSRKTINEVIEKDLEFNNLDKNMILN